MTQYFLMGYGLNLLDQYLPPIFFFFSNIMNIDENKIILYYTKVMQQPTDILKEKVQNV